MSPNQMPQRRPTRVVQGRYADLARRWAPGIWIDTDRSGQYFER